MEFVRITRNKRGHVRHFKCPTCGKERHNQMFTVERSYTFILNDKVIVGERPECPVCGKVMAISASVRTNEGAYTYLQFGCRKCGRFITPTNNVNNTEVCSRLGDSSTIDVASNSCTLAQACALMVELGGPAVAPPTLLASIVNYFPHLGIVEVKPSGARIVRAVNLKRFRAFVQGRIATGREGVNILAPYDI
jgi:predicted RNA-binding Zn-ribbon protein involved in translation (DUF1610 family)